jgi:hydrogenase maturation protein HypF
LEEIPLIGGEMAIKDIKRLMFAILSLLSRDADAAQFVAEKEAKVMEKLMNKAPKTSSFGRVLDALSCYLGICNMMTVSRQ